LDAIETEMFVPGIAARVKEQHDVARQRIDAREIRPLVGVASPARPGQIALVVVVEMLLRDDMLDMERQEQRGWLRQLAVFAAVAGAAADKFTNLRVHFRSRAGLDSAGPWPE